MTLLFRAVDVGAYLCFLLEEGLALHGVVVPHAASLHIKQGVVGGWHGADWRAAADRAPYCAISYTCAVGTQICERSDVATVGTVELRVWGCGLERHCVRVCRDRRVSCVGCRTGGLCRGRVQYQYLRVPTSLVRPILQSRQPWPLLPYDSATCSTLGGSGATSQLAHLPGQAAAG